MKYIACLILIIWATSLCNAQSLLLKIEGPTCKKPSYILGTMHEIEIEKDSLPIYIKAEKLLDKVDAYAMEVSLKNETDYIRYMPLLQLSGNKKLTDYMSEDEFITLDSLCKIKYQIGLTVFIKYKPLFITMLIESYINKNDNYIQMDMVLEKYANNKKKKIFSLETIESQLGVFDSISIEEQIHYFRLGLLDTNRYTTYTLRNLYLQNDAEKLYNYVSIESDDEFMKYYIINRNKAMAEKIETYIKKHSILIAVGAGHLGGVDGIIAILKKKGYTLSNVMLVE